MAELDVSDAFGPDIVDGFTVRRRREVVNAYGESTVPAPQEFAASGVVCRSDPNDVERLAEYDVLRSYISIVTKTRLYGPVKSDGNEYKPDEIVWQGNTYVVEKVDPYTNFGTGFVQAIAGSIESVGEAPSPEPA